MTSNWLNQLGDSNPQLLRELRGRLQLRSVAVTIGLAILGQILLLIFFQGQIPENASRYTEYCLNKVGPCEVNWIFWWRSVCKALTFMIPYAVLIPATFMLVTDISNEAEKGTLNFLRLSPRSSSNILLGKLLGVPILSYLTVLLLLPLHLLTAILSQTSLFFIASVYFALALSAILLLNIASLLGFLGGSQPKLMGVAGTQGLAVVVLVTIGWIPVSFLINTVFLWPPFTETIKTWQIGGVTRIDWFGLPINQHWPISHGFLLLNVGLLSYWVWRVLRRSFRQPTATAVSKRQAYLIAPYFALLLLGFMGQVRPIVANFPSDPTPGAQIWLGKLAFLSSTAIIAGLPLIFALSTPRQMLIDWLQSRQETNRLQRQQGTSVGKRRSEQIREWLLGEKSPGITAIWGCILLIYCMISSLLPFTQEHFPIALVGLCLSAALIANYSLLVQLCLLLPTNKRYVWAVGSLAVIMVIPTICSILPGFNWLAPYFTPGLWLPLTTATSVYSQAEMTLSRAIVALIIHVILLIAQVTLFRDQLRQLGRVDRE